MTDLTEPFHDFVTLFEQTQTPYALIGGLAVSAHGLPRPTHDLDFTILVPRDGLSGFFESVVNLGYSIPESYLAGWVDRVGEMPLVRARAWLRGKMIDVDLSLAESPFQHELLKRRIRVHVEGIDAWLSSPEDLVLLKLVAGRPRDFGDITDIFFMQDQLDEDYLRHWAAELGVSERLEEALGDARGDADAPAS